MSATNTAAILICCVFTPLVSLCTVAVVLVPPEWKLLPVGLELLLILAMGVLLGAAVRRAKSMGKD